MVTRTGGKMNQKNMDMQVIEFGESVLDEVRFFYQLNYVPVIDAILGFVIHKRFIVDGGA